MTRSALPFRDGTVEQFARIRSLLCDCDYTSEGICTRYDIPALHQFRSYGEGRRTGLDLDDGLDVLSRLFLDGLAVPHETVRDRLPPEGLDALLAIRLVATHPLDASRLGATVQLYPSGPLYIVSDLDSHVPGIAAEDELDRSDHVFSANTTLTGTFLAQLPDTPCDRFLELCAGTGAAALRVAASATHTTATDITERSTRFAEFNARLNGIRNFEAVEGDLFEPVAGRTFDRIVAHPPYVPATEVGMIYRDGGEDGESVIRRLLAGLPEYLETNGTFHCTCMATDRRDAALEDRIRGMIGTSAGEFDLIVVVHESMPPGEYYGRLAVARRITFETADERLRLFERLEAENVVYCSFVLRRHGDSRGPVTLRRRPGTGASARDSLALLDWAARTTDAQDLRAILDLRPSLSPAARLRVTHAAEGGEWKVREVRLEVEHPFARTIENASHNLATLLTLFNGERTVREIFDRIRSGGGIPEEAPESAFLEFVREFVSEGVLRVGSDGEGYPPVRRR
jgi:SAM-dependent methyltransferase